MRRLFIMRKDLKMSPGKLAAQVAHCAEAYWTNQMRKTAVPIITNRGVSGYTFWFEISQDEYENYVDDTFTKTICEARNKNHLLKAYDMAIEIGLKEGNDFGIIIDNCLTELEPEEDDGTTITGIWFCPLEDAVSYAISKKYQLYK